MSNGSQTIDETTEGRAANASLLDRLRDNRIAAILLAVILVGIAVFAFQWFPRDPGSDSVEAGFARDMSTHHGQAVSMALAIRDRTEDEQLFFLVTDMMLTQQNEIGMMTGWLTAWDLDLVGDEDPMTWMGHPTTGLMPGMATQEQIAQLEALPVAEAEVLFLQLMIRHHQGGVEMAEAYLERGDNDVVTPFAERIVTNQEKEISIMNQMLEQRGQPPITDPLPENHNEHS